MSEHRPLAGPDAAVLARYGGGTCPHCGAAIRRGDVIVLGAAGEWCHDRCPTELDHDERGVAAREGGGQGGDSR